MNAEPDILSHRARKPKIHILSLDTVLTDDIYERLQSHPKTRFYQLALPKNNQYKPRIQEIDTMAPQTTASRLLIFDVRKITLPWLQQAYNKIVGYNRKDFNRTCFSILIGDGPLNLLQNGKTPDIFIPHLASMRIDYSPAAFFYDPLIHYEPEEIDSSVDDTFVVPGKLPKRLKPFFPGDGVNVAAVRTFFRGQGQSEVVKKQRLKMLAAVYQKRIKQQFGAQEDMFAGWLSKDGARLATEKLHFYPIFFEEWVHELMQKAANT